MEGPILDPRPLRRKERLGSRLGRTIMVKLVDYIYSVKFINTQDDHQTFHIRYRMDSSPSVSSSYMSPGTPAPVPGMADSWLDVDESFSERLITADDSSESLQCTHLLTCTLYMYTHCYMCIHGCTSYGMYLCVYA